eukprot:1154511-Pelagomonas_calceolata.AAC.3
MSMLPLALNALATPFLKNAVKLVPRESGRGAERVNVLVPLIAQLFHLMLDKACIPKCWKASKITPLHKKGHVLDPGYYRMLAVSGTMYCLSYNFTEHRLCSVKL